jgi:hypothetical protein
VSDGVVFQVCCRCSIVCVYMLPTKGVVIVVVLFKVKQSVLCDLRSKCWRCSPTDSCADWVFR